METHLQRDWGHLCQGRRKGGRVQIPPDLHSWGTAVWRQTHTPFQGVVFVQQMLQMPSAARGQAPEQARPWGWVPHVPDQQMCPPRHTRLHNLCPQTRLFCRHQAPVASHPLMGPSLLPCLHADRAGVWEPSVPDRALTVLPIYHQPHGCRLLPLFDALSPTCQHPFKPYFSLVSPPPSALWLPTEDGHRQPGFPTPPPCQRPLPRQEHLFPSHGFVGPPTW